MVPDHPFHPPMAADRAEPWTHRGAVAVALTWALSGACVGTATGATLQLVGQPSGSGALGVVGIVTFAATGLLALGVERRSATRRPGVLDMRGRIGKPLHGALFAVPIALAAPMSLWLVVVGSVAAGSLWPALGFGMSTLAMAWGGAKVWSGHRMARALEALELGRVAEAREALEGLQGSLFAGRGARISARLGLGGVALRAGELDEAARWYATVQRGGAAGFASAGLAMIHVLRDRLDAAEEEVQAAMGSAAARQVQPQLDAVRLLLLWRRHGPAEARAFGERLLGPEAGALFRALLAEARRATGDGEGADALRAEVDGAVGGLVELVPELGARRG